MPKKSYKQTKEHKKKISETPKGKHNSLKTEFKKGKRGYWKEKKFSEEHKRNISKNSAQYWKGKKFSKEHKEKVLITGFRKGVSGNPKTQFKKGINNKGKNNPNWKGGVSNINLRLRQSKEYKLWKNAVFERDNYLCIWCGSCKNIQADHIKPFSLFPELRFAIDNGRTLCKECHGKTDTFAGKLNKKSGGI